MITDDLLPHIYEKVTGVPRTTALRRLTEATRQFCRDTHAWRENVTVELVADQALYDLGMPVDPESPDPDNPVVVAEVRKIHQVLMGEKRVPLEKKTETQMELMYHPGRSSQLDFYSQPRASQIKFYGTPSAAHVGVDVIVSASFQPLRDATYLPDEFGSRYYETLVNGALSLLFGSPHEKWSNITQAQRFGGAFAAGVEDARIEVEHEFSNRVVRVVRYGGI